MMNYARSLALLPIVIGSLAFLTAGGSPLAGQAPDAAPEPEALALEEALQAALATHPLLDGATASADAADAGRAEARAGWFPTLALSGTATRYEEETIVAPLHRFDPADPPLFDRTLFQGRLDAGYALFDGGARGARTTRAAALLAAAESGVRLAREEVILGTASAFARARAAETRRAAAEARVSAATAEAERAARMAAEGAAADVERLRADAALRGAEADLAAALGEESVHRRQLARWMGEDPAALAARPLEGLVPQETGVPVDAPPVNAAIDRARHVAGAADAALDAARATRFPRLDLRAGLIEFGSADGDFQGEWQAGVALTFPLFTGGARGAAIDRASAEARAARSALASTRLERANAIDRWTASLDAAFERGAALAERVDALVEVERIEALALREGVGTQRDLLDAQADLFEARAALADTEAQQAVAALEMARAAGLLTVDWVTRTLERTP
ncbi:MAG: TolC family protein [Gemmatimonadota bacterium]